MLQVPKVGTDLFLNVNQRPHSTSHIVQSGVEPLTPVGEVDPAFRSLTRGGRSALRPLPTDTGHIAWLVQT